MLQIVALENVNEVIARHQHWLRAQLSCQAELDYLAYARANFTYSDFSKLPRCFAGCNLGYALFLGAKLANCDLSQANLSHANFYEADLTGADLKEANLTAANLAKANLTGADLTDAILIGADLNEANLTDVRGLIKRMGVEPGGIYWKRFGAGLVNHHYHFRVGRNDLGRVFASDERILCSRPGFHFASRSWCAWHYPYRPLEARIRIPEDAQVNEPWATDGEASASAIEILQVFDVATGKDVTEDYCSVSSHGDTYLRPQRKVTQCQRNS